MKKTLCAMIFSCLMVVGLAGCGGDDGDLVGDTCKKMDECGFLMGMTVSDCKKLADGEGAEEATAAQEKAARACLAKSCSEIVTCLDAVE